MFIMYISSFPARSSLQCLEHSKPMKYFCETCNQLACTLCVTKSHDKHEVKHTKSQTEQIKEDMNHIIDTLSNEIGVLVSNDSSLLLRKVEKHYKKAEYDISKHGRDLMSKIAKQEKLYLREVQTRKTKLMETLQTECQINQSNLDLLKNVRDTLGTFARGGNDERLLLTFKDTQTKVMNIISTLPDRIKSVPQLSSVPIVRFEAGDENGIKFGKLLELIIEVDEGESNPSFIKQKSFRYKSRKKHTSKTKEDTETNVLHDLQRRQSLDELMRVDVCTCDPTDKIYKAKVEWCRTKNKFEQSKDDIAFPCDVTILHNTNEVEYAVADTETGCIHILDDRGDTIRRVGEGTINPLSVAAMNNNNLITTDKQNKCVKIYTPHSESVSAWSYVGHNTPCGVAVSRDDHVIVTDVGSSSVFIHDISGQLIRTFGSLGTGV